MQSRNEHPSKHLWAWWGGNGLRASAKMGSQNGPGDKLGGFLAETNTDWTPSRRRVASNALAGDTGGQGHTRKHAHRFSEHDTTSQVLLERHRTQSLELVLLGNRCL